MYFFFFRPRDRSASESFRWGTEVQNVEKGQLGLRWLRGVLAIINIIIITLIVYDSLGWIGLLHISIMLLLMLVLRCTWITSLDTLYHRSTLLSSRVVWFETGLCSIHYINTHFLCWKVFLFLADGDWSMAPAASLELACLFSWVSCVQLECFTPFQVGVIVTWIIDNLMHTFFGV